MSAFLNVRIAFSILTLLTILCVFCLNRYLKSKSSKSNNDEPNIVIKNHEINVRFRSREYVILLLIFIIEFVFLLHDILNLILTDGITWALTLIQLQILLVWYIQEQRQISEINMVLRILSLSFTLFFGWVFLLFLLFHDLSQMRRSLFIIFITNLILSFISIIHNVLFKHKIKYIKIQSPLKPWLVNIILFLLAIISLFECITGVPLHEKEAKAFATSYRILTFICILFICFMITVRRKKDNAAQLTVGGSYKEGDIVDEFHGRSRTLYSIHDRNATELKLTNLDSEKQKEETLTARFNIHNLNDLKQVDDNEKAQATMYEYGRREGNKSWQSVEATIIGGEGVGKTLLIRSLWKLDISDVQPKYKKKSGPQRRGSAMKRLSYLDNAELLDYDRYNMIDCYRRWDPILRVKFKLWDTVGDVRFLNSILKCMLSSEVIIAMYTLQNDRYVHKNEMKEEEEESNKKLMNVDETVKFLLSVESGIRQLVSNTHRKDEEGVDLRFAVLLIGISKTPLTTKLREKNKKIFEWLGARCKHLRFHIYPTADGDPSQIFHINYKQSSPRMTNLVQILWSIYQMKKSALQNKYISDSRICCGMIKVPNSTIYTVSATLAYNITHQPFVLRKIDQNKHYHSNITSSRQNSASSISIGRYATSLQRAEKRQVVGGPIASVHHWQLKRPKGVILYRTMCCLMSGIFFPFLVVMQTTMFWCYCAEWGITNEGLSKLVSNYRISQYGTFLLDFLYPIFPRSQPDPAVESAINTGLRSLLNQKSSNGRGIFKIDWFFRQTNIQKIIRTLIAFSIVLLATFLSYNFLYWLTVEDESENDVSNVESIGGLLWFVIIWLMMGSWYGHRVDIQPDVDVMFADEDRTSFRLHYKDTSYNNDIIHTNVEVFLRSYTFYHASKSKRKVNWSKTSFFIIIGIVYSLIPGLHRVLAENKPFLSRDNPYVAVRAMMSNFVLIALAQYVFDKAFYSYFQQYESLIFDVTTLIEIPGDAKNTEFEDDEDTDEEETKKPSYHGSGFEFLSLDDPENLISWLEIRSYAYVKGRQLFAELELFILFFCIIMILQAGFVVLTLFSNAGESVEESISATFLCIMFMFIINMFWMLKVFILGTKFDQLQRRQQYALVNQMCCIRSEALTTAVFTGPMGWIELNVGAWDRLYTLLHERSKRYRKQKKYKQTDFENKFLGKMLNFDMQSDDDSGDGGIQHIIVESEEENKLDIKTEKIKIKQVRNKKDIVYKKRLKKLKEKVAQYFYEQHREEEKWKEMRSLQEDFDHYLDLLMLAYYKVQQNSIHPKIFGLGLSGALMKTMATAMVTTVLAIIRFVFVA